MSDSIEVWSKVRLSDLDPVSRAEVEEYLARAREEFMKSPALAAMILRREAAGLPFYTESVDLDEGDARGSGN